MRRRGAESKRRQLGHQKLVVQVAVLSLVLAAALSTTPNALASAPFTLGGTTDITEERKKRNIKKV